MATVTITITDTDEATAFIEMTEIPENDLSPAQELARVVKNILIEEANERFEVH